MELSTPRRGGWICVFGGLPTKMLMIDATIRSVHADRYGSVDATGRKAAQEKQSTYGTDVLTWALNPEGRWQPQAQFAAEQLVQMLSVTSERSVGSVKRELTTAVEMALYTGTADTTLKCLGTGAKRRLEPREFVASPPLSTVLGPPIVVPNCFSAAIDPLGHPPGQRLQPDAGGFGTGILPTGTCLLYTSPSPRDQRGSRMPSSA